jgi:hypothetical protein
LETSTKPIYVNQYKINGSFSEASMAGWMGNWGFMIRDDVGKIQAVVRLQESF